MTCTSFMMLSNIILLFKLFQVPMPKDKEDACFTPFDSGNDCEVGRKYFTYMLV